MPRNDRGNTRPTARQTAVVSHFKHRVKARVDDRPVDFHPYHGRSGWLKELEGLITDLRRDNVPFPLTNIETNWHRDVAYVGMSRARTRLHIIIHEDCDGKRREREVSSTPATQRSPPRFATLETTAPPDAP